MFKQLATTAALAVITFSSTAVNASPATAEYEGDMSARCVLTANNTGTFVNDGLYLTTEETGGERVELGTDVIGTGYSLTVSGGGGLTTTLNGQEYSKETKVVFDQESPKTIRSSSGTPQQASHAIGAGTGTTELGMVLKGQDSGNALTPGIYNAELTVSCTN